MATRSREKSAARKANADKRPRAIAKYVRISSRKVKVVIDLIRCLRSSIPPLLTRKTIWT